MKHDWKIRPFEDSIVKVKYTTKISSNDYLKQGLYPIVSQEEGLISGYWNNEEDVFKISSPVVIFGDHTRILKYVNFDFVLGADGVKILQPIDSINAKFFMFYLKSCRIPSLGYSRHYKLLKELNVPVPPMEEQERIVAELDCLSGVIEKKREQLRELDTLAQSIFYQMFGDPITNEKGWEVKKLLDAVSIDCPISYGIVQPMDDVEGGIPIVRPIDLVDTFVRKDNLKRTSVDISNAYKRTILRGDEILMCVRGTMGVVSMASDELKGCNTTRGIVPLFFDNINRWFVFYLIKQPSMQCLIAENTYGIALKQINIKELRLLPIITPPLANQQEFADKIEAIEKQKELIKQSITQTEELFNARMDYYFN